MKSLDRVVYREPEGEVKKCIIGLTGRGQHAQSMLNILNEFPCDNLLTIAIQPSGYEWYPQPISSFAQRFAVNGLEPARLAIVKVVEKIKEKFNIKNNQDIGFFGYSAGGVMSNYTCFKNQDEPFKFSMCLCGAILEPNKINKKNKNHNTKYFLVHNEDDACFEWHERYLPMKKMLIKNKYDVNVRECESGGHGFYKEDVEFLFDELKSLFNI